MKAQEVMRSSKFTQAGPNQNDFNDYQNIGMTAFQVSPSDDGSQNGGERISYVERHSHNVNQSSEQLLKNSYDGYKTQDNMYKRIQRYSPERNVNSFPLSQDIELCNCTVNSVYLANNQCQSLTDQYNSEQTLVLNSFTSLPKLDSANLKQVNRDRLRVKQLPQHSQQRLKYEYSYPSEQDQRILRELEKTTSLSRIQSPEIININRATFYEGSDVENCAAKGFKCDIHEFRRGLSVRSSGSRSNMVSGQPKKQMPSGGMKAEDPELIFEITKHHLGDCHCACDHVVHSSTTCLQDERTFAPAPDVTRRIGSSTKLGKLEPPGSPPYYRSTSAASSSTISTSSRGIDLTARHWWIIATVLFLAAAAGVGVPIALKISSSASFEERLEFATRLLQEVPLIDGHNDLPWNIRKFLHNKLKNFKFNDDLRKVMPWSTSSWSHTDLLRLEQGHVAAQFWAAYVPCDSQHKDAVQLTLEQIDVIRRFTEQYHPRLTLCTSSEDIKKAFRRHQICSLIGVEGGHSLAGSLAVLRTLYNIGVRYLTLTSTCNTPWADCSHADMPGQKTEHGGLTDFGKSVIKEMNRLGMIVDLSHVSVNTMKDALEVSNAPVIFSHSSAHALCNSTRNVPDETLRKLALNKGIIMVNFYNLFLTCNKDASIADAIAHINHIKDVAGVDSVGLGAGYDGINYVPDGLKDVSSYPALFAELIGTGKWSVDDLKKLAGLNFLRVLQDTERIRDDFKKANVPPYEDVLTPKPKENNCTSQAYF